MLEKKAIVIYLVKANMKEIKRLKVPCYHYADYILQKGPAPKRVYLLLHGYGESSEKIYKRLEPILPKNSIIIAPNGFFPLPKMSLSGVKLNFAWYFFDPVIKKYLIDYDLPATFLKNLVDEVIDKTLPITIIGYSQGGYLSPFVAQKINQVDHVIAVNCNYKYDMLEEPLNFKMDGIHGRQDSIVDPIQAEESHKELQRRGMKGNFYGLEEEDHKFTTPYLTLIEKLVSKHH